MLTIKNIGFNYRGSPNGSDVVIVELNENIDERIIMNSWKEKISVPTFLGILYFDVNLSGNTICLSTTDKEKFNDALCGSSDKLKNSIENYVSILNKRIKDLH